MTRQKGKQVSESPESDPQTVEVQPTPQGSRAPFHVDGDVRLRAGETAQIDVEVNGDLHLEENSTVQGRVLVHGDALMARGARVQGYMDVEGGLHAEPGTHADHLRVEGPLYVSRILVARHVMATEGFEVADDTRKGARK